MPNAKAFPVKNIIKLRQNGVSLFPKDGKHANGKTTVINARYPHLVIWSSSSKPVTRSLIELSPSSPSLAMSIKNGMPTAVKIPVKNNTAAILLSNS